MYVENDADIVCTLSHIFSLIMHEKLLKLLLRGCVACIDWQVACQCRHIKGYECAKNKKSMGFIVIQNLHRDVGMYYEN